MALGYMIGKFVSERESNPVRQLIGPNQIDADELRFFTCVQCEPWDRDRCVRSDQNAAVPFIEPFRLRAYFARTRFAVVKAELEHFHRIGQRALRSIQIRMHGIPRICASQMG